MQIIEIRPLCFDSDEQWKEWVAAARQVRGFSNAVHKGINHCEDCTAQYAEKMRACGRCEHPEVEFKGRHPLIEDTKPLKGPPGVRFRSGKYQALYNNKSLGYFDTQDEAMTVRAMHVAELERDRGKDIAHAGKP